MAETRKQALLEVCSGILAPMVAADGGHMYVVAADDDGIQLHLAGTCAGCPGAVFTAHDVIEPALRAVAPGVRVAVTAGIAIPAGAELVTPEPR